MAPFSARSTEEAPDPARIGLRDVRSDDGTRIVAWTNDPEGTIGGPTVLLCNGLGTNPWAWPALLRPDCKVRVVSWYHRGIGGSERPADPDHVGIEAFVEDALSVMDHFGIDRTVAMGWSMGVNTMFELAFRHPERISALFAIAGVPGDTFGTMLGPLRLPHGIAELVTVNVARTMKYAGRLISPFSTRLPVGNRAIGVLSHTGFMLPMPDPELAARAVKAFLETPVEWYMHLALATSSHRRVSLSSLRVPAAFVAGKWDVLAGSRAMKSAADRMPGAIYVELNGSHFIQMEQPDVVHDLLLDFLERTRVEQVA